MKFFCSLIVVGLFNFSAFAEENYYLKVKDMFEQSGSTVPTQAELVGWNSGRCYVDSEPSKPIAGMLVGFNHEIGGGNGPEFPSKVVFKFDLLSNMNAAVDYFDVLHPSMENQVIAAIGREQSGITEMYTNEGAAAVTVGNDNYYHVKKNGKYLVARSKAKTGREYGYCYLFNKLK